MRKIQPFQYDYTSGNSRAGFFSIIGSHKSLGQAFLKACGCPEGKALGLHDKPIFILFHNFRSVYTQCALRGVNCETIRGIVSQERGALQERAPL